MIIKRDHYVRALLGKRWNGKVKIITGIRRCGKSFLLSTLYKGHLKADGVPDDCFVAHLFRVTHVLANPIDLAFVRHLVPIPLFSKVFERVFKIRAATTVFAARTKA